MSHVLFNLNHTYYNKILFIFPKFILPISIRQNLFIWTSLVTSKHTRQWRFLIVWWNIPTFTLIICSERIDIFKYFKMFLHLNVLINKVTLFSFIYYIIVDLPFFVQSLVSYFLINYFILFYLIFYWSL